MKYNIDYKDLGVKDYKQTWDYQTEIFEKLVSFKKSFNEMELKHDQRPEGTLIFVEHPHVYTLGKSGHMENVLLSEEVMEEKEIEFFRTNRGGDITFHGLQQLVGYPILDLEKFETDIGKYLRNLEEVIIRTIAEYNIKGVSRNNACG